MFRFLSKKKPLAAISIFFLFCQVGFCSEMVRVCVWSGSYKPSLESFKGKYRGQLSLIKWNRRYLVINTMDIEEYLYGVIGKEMEKSWPFEALKAQAVCSRTLIFYYRNLATKKKLPYDVSDTIYHQVYGGVYSENESIVRAVEETSNEILVAGQNGENGYNIVPSFFHACCGGHTSTASDVWGGNYPSLKGVEDPFCSGTPFYSWSKSFTQNDLKGIVGIPVSSVQVLGYNDSGRVAKIEFSGKSGSKVMTAESFRMMTVNGSTTFSSRQSLPSTLFTVRKQGNVFLFEGKGYGHGVGLCQWGAKKMAEQGKTYKEILGYYFPELCLVRVETSEDKISSAVGTVVP